MIPSVSLHLLTQDNTIPGNRKDGFRYNHLLFVIIITPLYLWLELAFGVRLLDVMGTNVRIQDTEVIANSGRLISGAAVALFLLAGWFRQAEKKDLPWGRVISVSVLITFLSFFVAWHLQEMVLDFYVKRSNDELKWSFLALALFVGAGYWLYQLWLRKLANFGHTGYRYLWLVLGAVVLIGLAVGQSQLRKQADPGRGNRLGEERQRTATLTLIRRGLQEGLVTLPGGDHPRWALNSPEGKTYLALFPIFGSVYDQRAFAAERPRLLAEFIYRDWDTEFGGQAFEGYRSIATDLNRRYDEDYRHSRKGLELGDRTVPPGLDRTAFAAHPAVLRYLRTQLACFDCEFTLDMNREQFGRELFKWTKAHHVQEAIELFSDPKNFQQGDYGDLAARTYWAPILVLLFSMLGVFVHVFRLVVTVADYRHRLTFNRVGAADSPLARAVTRNSAQVTAGTVAALVLFTFFSDNRITGDTGYTTLRAQMWRERPLVGAIAAHWTVNAQGFIYPFTRKICPDWMSFERDPMVSIPIVRRWFINKEYE